MPRACSSWKCVGASFAHPNRVYPLCAGLAALVESGAVMELCDASAKQFLCVACDFAASSIPAIEDHVAGEGHRRTMQWWVSHLLWCNEDYYSLLRVRVSYSSRTINLFTLDCSQMQNGPNFISVPGLYFVIIIEFSGRGWMIFSLLDCWSPFLFC